VIFPLMNTDAQSAGPPKLDKPQHNYSTAKSRSRRSKNHARGSLGSLGLASLFACCFVPFSLRWFGIRVATLPASLGWASRRPKLCITQLGLAARSSALLVAAARIVRRRVVGLHCAHMLTTPIGPRIVRCSVSLGRAARSPATRRCSQLLAGARCISPRLAAPPSLLLGTQTLSQQEKDNSVDVHAGQSK
jgi:hypothetical protein